MDAGLVFDLVGKSILYTAIALVGAELIVGILAYFFKRDRFSDVVKMIVGIDAGVVLAAIVAVCYIKGRGAGELDMGDLFDLLGRVLLYTIVAVIGAELIVGALVYFLKRDRFNDVVKVAAGIDIGVAIVAIVAMSYIKGLDTEFFNDGLKLLFWPIMAEIIIVMVGALSMLICSIFGKTPFKIAAITTGAGALGGFIAIVVQMSKYYKTVEAEYNANLAGLIVATIVIVAILCAAYALGNKQKISDTRSIVYGAIAIALAFALSYAKFFEMPQGGSVTFASLLPLMIYCCMFGTRRGIIVCLIYGTLQAVQDPWIIHPLQFLLDYPLAFGLIGVSGIFVEKGLVKKYPIVGFVVGAIVAVCLRFACHVCSGIFAFASWADLDTYGSVTAYSMAYNSFAFIDMIIDIAAGALLFGSRAFVTQMQRSTSATNEVAAAGPVEEEDDFEAQIFSTSDSGDLSSAASADVDESSDVDGIVEDEESHVANADDELSNAVIINGEEQKTANVDDELSNTANVDGGEAIATNADDGDRDSE